MKNIRFKKYIPLLLLVLLLVLSYLATLMLDTTLHTRHYTIKDERICAPVRVVMLSDLHGTFYGQNQQELVSTIDQLDPHAVFLVGDIFDEHHDFSAATALLNQIAPRYPTYYVSGNHEYSTDFSAVKETLSAAGVICLWGENQKITLNGQEMLLGGVYDECHYLYNATPQGEHFTKQLRLMKEEKEEQYSDLFSILLCHRPEADILKNSGYNLIFSGHNHGGQVRIPGILNGLFAPSQGFIPSYAGGLYTLNEQSTLIVGRGLVRNHAPRIFNPPEIVYVELLPA